MGSITVIGIGPGRRGAMTIDAAEAVRKADIVVGYRTYIDLLRRIFPDKRFEESGMRSEEARCRRAVELAKSGAETALVSSGDAGVYGMAGLCLSMAAGTGIPVRVIPGVTAASSGAALLGAPLENDFAVISLSDLLLPREEILGRVRAAAESDFVLCLYNPGSHTRRDILHEACGEILRFRPEDTPCGIARNIGRDGETAEILTLGGLRDRTADMLMTIFIGNSRTRILGGKLVTARGYREEK
jgi:precorrin-3B C17-methyltransferase